MLLRSLAHGHRCAVLQFIKGDRPSGEQRLLEACERLGGTLEWHRYGAGFTWKSGAEARNQALARGGWAQAQGILANPEVRFVLFDELNVVLHHGFLEVEAVLQDLRRRPATQHVVVTGRHAPQVLVEAADLVTEMREVKHPFRWGVPAQAGIEF